MRIATLPLVSASVQSDTGHYSMATCKVACSQKAAYRASRQHRAKYGLQSNLHSCDAGLRHDTGAATHPERFRIAHRSHGRCGCQCSGLRILLTHVEYENGQHVLSSVSTCRGFGGDLVQYCPFSFAALTKFAYVGPQDALVKHREVDLSFWPTHLVRLLTPFN